MATIDLATYVARVEVDSTGLQKGLGQSDKAVESSIGKTSKNVSLAMKAVQVAVVASVAKMSKEIISVGSSFESGMSEVQAISGATGDDLERLSEKAKEMGRNTKFSASEASEGLKYMAMAGWDTNSMLDGLDGVMMLAAASGEDLAMVSDIVTDALSGFGMEAHQASEFADLLASTSSNSNTNVAMLGESFKYVAPLAGALGYSAEDTALALGLMANAGIKGSQAGTTLRNVMTGLTTPTKASAESMAQLGIEVANADGTMKPFNEVLVDMREKFDKLTPAQKAQHAQAIAGKQGMAGLLAIMEASPEEFEKLTQATTDYNGVAEEMSEIMEDNLQGDINKLKSALEGLAIDIYEGVTPALRFMTQGFTDMIGVVENIIELLGVQFGSAISLIGKSIDEFVEENRDRFDDVFAGWEVAKDNFLSSWMNFFVSIRDTVTDNMDSIGNIFLNVGEIVNNATTLMGQALEVFGLAIEALAPIVGGLLDIITHVFGSSLKIITDTVGKIIKEIKKWVSENEKELTEMKETVGEIVDAIKEIWDKGTELIGKLLKAFGEALNINTKTVMDNIKNVIKIALDLIKNIVNLALAIIEGDWSKVWESIKGIVSAVWEAIKLVVSNALKAVVNILKGMISTFLGVAKKLFGAIWDGAKAIMSKLLSWITNPIKSIIRAFTGKYGEARSAGRGMFSSVWEGMKGIWSSLSNWVSSKVQWLSDKLKFWDRGSKKMAGGGGGGGGTGARAFAVGTPFVSHDQTALIHEGEAIIPKRYNPFTKGGHFKPEFGFGGGENNYNVQIDIDNVDSGIDIERAVQNGIERAENKRKRNLKKKGI